MTHGIYIGMTAASARAQQVDLIADNLANAQTPGFKAGTVRFESVVAAREVEGATQDKIMTRVAGTGLDTSRGLIETTGNPLDIVIGDDAWLEVEAKDGNPAYTRNGHLHVSPDGVLMAGRHPVRSAAGAELIVPKGQAPTIRPDGSVMVGQRSIGKLGLANLSGDLDRIAPTVIALGDDGVATPAQATVRTGEVELSNYQGMDAAVDMIQAQRSFDQSMQAIQTYSSLDQKVAEIGKV